MILQQMSWWNTYYHTRHGLIFEVRDTKGYGVRWKLSNLELIGFIDREGPYSKYTT